MHQDELSEVRDDDISDSESVPAISSSSSYPGQQSQSLLLSLEADNSHSVSPILIDSSSDELSNCSNTYGAGESLAETQQACLPRSPISLSLTNIAHSLTTDSRSISCIAQQPPSDIAHNTLCAPVRPKNITFPTTLFSKHLDVSTQHSTRILIGLNIQLNVIQVFVILVICLGHRVVCRPEPVFTTVGFRSWKHATGKTGALHVHSNCYNHKQAVVAWEQYKINAKRGTLLPDQMGSTREAAISKNRHYVKSVAEVLLLCSRQEIAL